MLILCGSHVLLHLFSEMTGGRKKRQQSSKFRKQFAFSRRRPTSLKSFKLDDQIAYPSSDTKSRPGDSQPWKKLLILCSPLVLISSSEYTELVGELERRLALLRLI
ncbi:Uncharacterized protein Rs2_07364 [Raphanus sativus]|nr:Uncharacterized protein Rs2_07364 [Raphanus sativus]